MYPVPDLDTSTIGAHIAACIFSFSRNKQYKVAITQGSSCELVVCTCTRQKQMLESVKSISRYPTTWCEVCHVFSKIHIHRMGATPVEEQSQNARYHSYLWVQAPGPPPAPWPAYIVGRLHIFIM